jgi:hypothetical protein
MLLLYTHISEGPSSYGSWIYNYLCNRCLSTPMLWVRISMRARCATFCDKVCQKRDFPSFLYISGFALFSNSKRTKSVWPTSQAIYKGVVPSPLPIGAYQHRCCEFVSRWGRGVQHFVIKFVSDVRQVSGFLRVFLFPPPIKLTIKDRLF